MHQLNPSQCLLRRVETLETQHRSALAFYVPTLLFDEVVETLALANFDTRVVVVIVALDRGCVRTAFIDIDQARLSVSADRFGEKTRCGFLIPFGR